MTKNDTQIVGNIGMCYVRFKMLARGWSVVPLPLRKYDLDAHREWWDRMAIVEGTT